MYKEYSIKDEVINLSKRVEEELQPIFKSIEDSCERNTLKVLKAFKDNSISDMHFGSTTGYGYGDVGRDTIEKVLISKGENEVAKNYILYFSL